MKGHYKIFLISILFLWIAACANQPVFQVEIYQTATPVGQSSDLSELMPTPFPTLPLVPMDTPVSEAVMLPTPAPTAFMPADFSPVLYGKKYDANTFFLLLGAVQGNTWLTPDQAVTQYRGEWEYDIRTFSMGSFQVHGSSPSFSPTSQTYFIGTDSNINEFGMVGVLHGWDARQGSVQELSPSVDTYQKAVLDWLKVQGDSSPEVGTLHVYRVDLEADGVDEIFISATHLDESGHTAKAGDYSIVLLRKVIGNDVTTLPLAADVYDSQQDIVYPSTYSLGNFIDLNRDGTLEVIVDVQGWEKFGALVYQVNGQTVMNVFQ